MQEMSVTYSQLDREARKAAKLAHCAAERATFLVALTEKRHAPPSVPSSTLYTRT